MIHEPECLEVGYELDPSEFCSICITARAAYKRGREDAARATELVGHVIGCGEDDNIWDYCACHSQSVYAAAARGDGAE